MSLRWGFLGASRIGRRALAPAVLAAGQRLHAVGARELERARAFGAARAYGSYAEVLNDPEVDAVYNALTNEQHMPWTIRALQAGKHVLCEKPLALSADEVRQMIVAEQASGRRVMEAFCHLAHPQVARARELLAAGAIGDLVAIDASYGMTLERPDNYRWLARHGGGSLYDLGCYCVSLMRVLSDREPVRAAAVPAMRGDVDVSFSGLLDFCGGVGGRFVCSYASAYAQLMTLIGSRDVLTLDRPFATKDRVTQLAIGERVEEIAAIDPYLAMVQHFERAVHGEELQYGLEWSLRQALAMDLLRFA